jgi:DNA polymerase I-like protein with 3'-5' exonuclease and polymerase domains
VQIELNLRGGVHRPVDRPTSDWRPPSLDALPAWKGVKRVGIDCETHDPDLRRLGPGVRRGARMVGYSFSIEGGPRHYLPFGHADPEDNLPAANCIRYLVDQFREYDGEVCGANLGYDLDFLWSAGVKMPMVRKYRDCLMADALLFVLHNHYDLDSVARRRGLEGKNEELLRAAAKAYGIPEGDVKLRMHELPARYVGPYAEDDAHLPLLLLAQQEREIASINCGEAWETECDLLPILVRMRQRGVRVSERRLDLVEQWTLQKERDAFDQVKTLTGVDIPVGHSMNVELCARALSEAGVVVPETATGKKSVRRDVLEEIDHPVAASLVKARRFAKYRGTYVQGVRDHLTRGRIHCTFSQMRKSDDDGGEGGVAYGRMASEHTNMQNQPSASRLPPGDDSGHVWRSIYLPEDGEVWASKDLKQQEPRWSFHISSLLGLPGAEELCAALRADPTLDTYKPLAAAAGIPRSAAKIIWLSLAYGKGDGGLCEDLGLPTAMVVWDRSARRAVQVDSDRGRQLTARGSSADHGEAKRTGLPFVWKGAGPEGQAVLDKFEEGAPFLRKAAKAAQRAASERGYVRLVDGRRLHFPSTDNEWTRKAFNRVIQGNSAVQTKRIMVALSNAGYDAMLRLQVHDEIASSVPSRETAMAMAEVMRGAVPMRVPVSVDVETGPSWGESMALEMPDGSKREFKWELGQ